MMAPSVLLLEYDESLLPESGRSEVVCCVAGLVKCVNKDAAGHVFHHYALLQKGLIERPKSTSDDEGDTEGESTSSDEQKPGKTKLEKLQSEEPPEGTQWKKAKKKKREVKKSTNHDLYALLGLQHERWMATEAQITKAYRKAALLHHPDKVAHMCQDEKEKEKVEEKFKLIQEAYELLSNPAQRREFDSTDDFDDTLPSECAPQDFFSVFGPAFRRNARWSVVTPVAELGDESTAWDEVELFYDFWYGFKSWREFPHPEEEDVASAECREHRRWIERQNSKLREKSKKDEGRRLREFVDNAYRIDPRVAQRKDAQKQARLRRKQEKIEARRKAEEEEREAARKEEAERKAREEAEKEAAREAKRIRQEAKQALEAAKRKLEDLCNTSNGEQLLDDESLVALTSKLNVERLTKLNNFLENEKANTAKCKKVLKRAVEDVADEEQAAIRLRREKLAAAEKAIKESRRKELEKKRQQMAEWNQEELRMLDKALNKFPQGTRKRWEQVAGYVGTRSMDEILMMVKDKKGAASKKFESQEDWRSAQKKKATNMADPSPTQAVEAFTDVQVDRKDSNQGGAKVAVSSETGTWTEEQELALVKALKTFGRDVEQRWDKICEVVPGKTKAQCFKRFKELRETFRANKS